MSKVIDTGITETDLFEAILREGELPTYDPAKHLHPKVAADRWGIGVENAKVELRKDKRLKEIWVRSPTNKNKVKVFVPA